MATTDYLEQLNLSYLVFGNDFTISSWYVGLWLTTPGPTGSLAGEVTASDYNRQAVTWNGNYGNASKIDWPAATSNWGTVEYIALVDSATKATGNVLIYEATSQAFNVTIGRPLTIPIDGLVLTMP